MKIGFIGLGTMGAFMAASLQKSQYKLVVTDIRRDAAKRHLENGAEWADTPKSVAEQCDIVFTSLPGPPDVEKVVFGADGLLAGAHAGMAVLRNTRIKASSPAAHHRSLSARASCLRACSARSASPLVARDVLPRILTGRLSRVNIAPVRLTCASKRASTSFAIPV